MSELLIALAILGVIATFTIPKVLGAQQGKRANAVVMETASTISGAYQAYLQTHPRSGSILFTDLTPYINYTKVDTSGALVDSLNTWANDNCNPAAAADNYYCLRMHNGATLAYPPGVGFGGTSSTNSMWFHVDPDGTYSGLTSGNGKATSIILYYDGRVTSWGATEKPIESNAGSYAAAQIWLDPEYLTWTH